MLKVLVCIGSSCHIKGSYEIANAFEKAVSDYNIGDKVSVAGSFCIGKCNREGVTVQINDEVFVGLTIHKFDDFFKEHILKVLNIEE